MIDPTCFTARHIGPTDADIDKMLSVVGVETLDELIQEALPAQIADFELNLPKALSEHEAIEHMRSFASENKDFTSLIGCGYHSTITPSVIVRNILESPAWYTAYTPYQPEISQGRLEALLNFQTMTADLCGMDIANASLLDEGTAAAEAMVMLARITKNKRSVFRVDSKAHPQTIAVVRTRAEPIGVEVRVEDREAPIGDDVFGVLIQYPDTDGEVTDLKPLVDKAHDAGALVAVAADIMSLVLLQSPGQAGADVVVGSTQRFGVPMAAGGPHAAYMATRAQYQRNLPGRVVGVSVDAEGKRALRLALQTREQHIRRERATSNICTAQVLLAVMAAMYASYHGPDGLKTIAGRIHDRTRELVGALEANGFTVLTEKFFDAIKVSVPAKADEIAAIAESRSINLRRYRDDNDHLGIALDETTTAQTLIDVLGCFGIEIDEKALSEVAKTSPISALGRTDTILDYEAFHAYQSETEMLRYLRRLSDKDIALDRSMIPLGSCTMKLNATTSMEPITWPEFTNVHPFAPADQHKGFEKLIENLTEWLAEITGYDKVSIQPNAGSQGELAGLLAIRAYHKANGDHHRNICLIPASAHGTNAASAVMAGMKVVVVKCDRDGNVDMVDLKNRIATHAENIAAVMITYPSTHGVFEDNVVELCAMIHDVGGQVYLDGANLNALVGIARPGRFGGDATHLNLHKTFSIPHGGGGPGVGPVCVGEHLAEFLPTEQKAHPDPQRPAISAAPWGSAGVLAIPYLYIAMLGAQGLRKSTEVAILSANYVAVRLRDYYPVLYTGQGGYVAHECIIDLRPLKEETGIGNDDVAKRLMDYGFHAPTMSFPVAGTLMIEPTESESLKEIDRFCDAMILIAQEAAKVGDGTWPLEDNPLVNSPHTAQAVTADEWTHPYARSEAAYPQTNLREQKVWPATARIDGAYGDRNFICSCPPLEDLAEDDL